MSIRTVSLETARKLKDAGFRKECHFGYCNSELECNPSPNEWPLYAPTTDELLDCISNDDLIYKYLESNNMNGTDLIWLMRDPNRLAEAWLWIKKETE